MRLVRSLMLVVLLPVVACTSGTDSQEHVLGSGRSGTQLWSAVALTRDGEDCVELRFEDKSVSGTCDFHLTEEGRLPAEFSVKATSTDLFVFGAVGADVNGVRLVTRDGTRLSVEPTLAKTAGTGVPVFFAHLPTPSLLASIEATLRDGRLIPLDPGPPVPQPDPSGTPSPTPPYRPGPPSKPG